MGVKCIDTNRPFFTKKSEHMTHIQKNWASSILAPTVPFLSKSRNACFNSALIVSGSGSWMVNWSTEASENASYKNLKKKYLSSGGKWLYKGGWEGKQEVEKFRRQKKRKQRKWLQQGRWIVSERCKMIKWPRMVSQIQPYDQNWAFNDSREVFFKISWHCGWPQRET